MPTLIFIYGRKFRGGCLQIIYGQAFSQWLVCSKTIYYARINLAYNLFTGLVSALMETCNSCWNKLGAPTADACLGFPVEIEPSQKLAATLWVYPFLSLDVAVVTEEKWKLTSTKIKGKRPTEVEGHSLEDPFKSLASPAHPSNLFETYHPPFGCIYFKMIPS